MGNTLKCLLLIAAAVFASGCDRAHVKVGQQDAAALSPAPATTYPRIVLYSTSWCPHCKAAMAYLAERNIPYINRDVEQDDEAMDLLLNRYGSKTVPVLVIGNDDAVLRGFDPAVFEKALRDHGKP
jgi:glutaredoxin 3